MLYRNGELFQLRCKATQPKRFSGYHKILFQLTAKNPKATAFVIYVTKIVNTWCVVNPPKSFIQFSIPLITQINSSFNSSN